MEQRVLGPDQMSYDMGSAVFIHVYSDVKILSSFHNPEYSWVSWWTSVLRSGPGPPKFQDHHAPFDQDTAICCNSSKETSDTSGPSKVSDASDEWRTSGEHSGWKRRTNIFQKRIHPKTLLHRLRRSHDQGVVTKLSSAIFKTKLEKKGNIT